MALETLKGINEIDGFKVIDMCKIKDVHPEMFNESGQMDYKLFERDIRPNYFIYKRDDVNSLTFNIQDGPVKEKGVNGCQIDTIVNTALLMIQGLNKSYPCNENNHVMYNLSMAMYWLKKRKADREARDVEGKNEQ